MLFLWWCSIAGNIQIQLGMTGVIDVKLNFDIRSVAMFALRISCGHCDLQLTTKRASAHQSHLAEHECEHCRQQFLAKIMAK